MKIPEHLKRRPYKTKREVLTSIRMTKADKAFLDKNQISPTALFAWALEKIKEDG